MEQILDFIKHLASSNAINFIVMVLILGWIIKKVNIASALSKNISGIENNIQKSDKTKADSMKYLDDAKALIDRLPSDIKELEKNSADKIEIFKNKIEENTQKSIQHLSENIDRVISIEEKKISNLLTEDTTKESMLLAEKNIKNLLSENPELHNIFIQNSIDELEKVQL